MMYGPDAMIFCGIALMKHLKPQLVESLQTQSQSVMLKVRSLRKTSLNCFVVSPLQEQAIYGFNFVENLEFIESLSTKYSEELSIELANPSLFK